MSPIDEDAIRGAMSATRAFGIVFGLLVLGASVADCLVGCSAMQDRTKETALLAEAAMHQAELSRCLDEGKQAKSYRVYVACADAVDQRFGIAITDGGLR